MVAYASYTAEEFLNAPEDLIFARLVRSDAVSGFSQFSHKQGWSWGEAIRLMKSACEQLIAADHRHSGVGVVLEYRIPRREKRLDAAFLFCNTVAVIEFKAGSSSATSEAIAQVSDYCLDLAYYHAQSQGKKIVPIVCSTEALSSHLLPASNETLISDIHCAGGSDLSALLLQLASEDPKSPDGSISHEHWCSSSYRPIPGIIETTVSLFNKHGAEDIEAALADRGTIDRSIEAIQRIIEESRDGNQKTLCLLTGVPGAGKTLTGLRIAHSPDSLRTGWRSVFLSGNGPLLRVLKAALAADYKDRQGCTKALAQRHAESLLHSVHAYLAEAQKSQSPTSENIIIFDEAQRAWDAAKMQKMAGRQRSFGVVSELAPQLDQASEPSQILAVMDRHVEGAVVIALCGSGQEIHDGEAGVGEWIAARNKDYPHWRLICSPSALELGRADPVKVDAETSSSMHLNISVRSHRASAYAAWVDAVLRGKPVEARLHADHEEFPVVLVRQLDEARRWLRATTLGSRRFGLVASSGCSRLRPYGIEVSAGFRKELDYAEWFTAPKGDLRSSFALETAATEFECQGLELDRVAVCWGWDLTLAEKELSPRTFRGTSWNAVRKSRDRQYIINKYRVLLTRAREGMVIWVPLGDEHDRTRSVAEMDELANYLVECGVKPISGADDSN
ncbi:DNA/RNA helicase domain-containing protein [Bradyrhizobium erythrophlei]|nr:DNA/RNA helicase domain-containing protein [Bradyrhizobium erythrophlei]